jgi:hypothetical protein
VSELPARGASALDATFRIAGRTTTAGRHLVAGCLPEGLRDATDQPWDAARGARVIARVVRELHVEIAARCVAALEELGMQVAHRSGLSIAADDFATPAEARAALAEAHQCGAGIESDYTEGLITDGERFNRQVDAWASAHWSARYDARRAAPEPGPLAAYAASHADVPAPDVARTFRGTIAMSTTIVYAMAGTLADGFGAHEYFVRATEARRRVLDAVERRQLALALFRDLDAVIGDLEIVAVDCGTARSVRVRAIEYDTHVHGSLAVRLEGRVLAEDLRDRNGASIAATGVLIDPALAQRIEAAHIASVAIRDVRTCDAVNGVCARCFGLAPEDALWTQPGDGVGERAAIAIATAGRHRPLRRHRAAAVSRGPGAGRSVPTTGPGRHPVARPRRRELRAAGR